jgi:LDH2 family malate/lactate/ureidoglycolate dehydrogenase
LTLASDDHYRVPAEKVKNLCNQLFQKVGLSKQDAEIVADNLIFADIRGVSSHGATRTASYINRAQTGFYNISPNIQILEDKGGLILLDGDNGFGAVISKVAMDLTLARAKEIGCAICSVRNSNHFGAASYYTTMASRIDMIGFCCTNSPANMAPYGSKNSMIGTNPFSIAIPAGEYPDVVLDIATSIVARGNIINAVKEGKPIPDGWAIDKEGYITNDAELALQGSVLPFGGYKGSGISIMIDAICGVLSGAEFGKHILKSAGEASISGKNRGSGIGHLFLAIDISPLQEINLFKSRIDQMISEIKSAELAPNASEILVPGELEVRNFQNSKQSGILLSEATISELTELCKLFQVGNTLEYAKEM